MFKKIFESPYSFLHKFHNSKSNSNQIIISLQLPIWFLISDCMVWWRSRRFNFNSFVLFKENPLNKIKVHLWIFIKAKHYTQTLYWCENISKILKMKTNTIARRPWELKHLLLFSVWNEIPIFCFYLIFFFREFMLNLFIGIWCILKNLAYL